MMERIRTAVAAAGQRVLRALGIAPRRRATHVESPMPEYRIRVRWDRVASLAGRSVAAVVIVGSVFALTWGALAILSDRASAGTPEPAPASVSQVGTADASDDAVIIPPCATEDSEDCYWDGATMGNGQGGSFIRWHGVTYRPESGDASARGIR